MDNHTAKDIKEAARRAFLETQQGRSTDDVIIEDSLNESFISAATKILPDVSPQEFNWHLMNLRKAGRLGRVTTVRRSLPDREEYLHASQIAARFMEDKYDITIDRIMCDPTARGEFDTLASSIAPGYPTYYYRKAALGLRKGGNFKPELLNRIMRQGTRTSLLEADVVLANPHLIPALPGVYMLADDTGVLYIGESEHLSALVRKFGDVFWIKRHGLGPSPRAFREACGGPHG